MHITKINAISLGKSVAIIFGIMSFLFGVFWSVFLPLLIKVLIPVLEANSGCGIGIAYIEIGIQATILILLKMSLISGALGLVLGVIVAMIYNFICVHTSGMEIEFKQG
jgi:hypothetical protein